MFRTVNKPYLLWVTVHAMGFHELVVQFGEAFRKIWYLVGWIDVIVVFVETFSEFVQTLK